MSLEYKVKNISCEYCNSVKCQTYPEKSRETFVFESTGRNFVRKHKEMRYKLAAKCTDYCTDYCTK